MSFVFLLFRESLLFFSFPSLWLPDSPAVWILLIASPARGPALCTCCILTAGLRDGVRLRLNLCLKTLFGVWTDTRSMISDGISLRHVSGHRCLMPVPSNSFWVAKDNILILLSLLLTICQLTFQGFKETVALFTYTLTTCSVTSFPVAGDSFSSFRWRRSAFICMNVSFSDPHLGKLWNSWLPLKGGIPMNSGPSVSADAPAAFLSLPLSLVSLSPVGHLPHLPFCHDALRHSVPDCVFLCV